MNKNIIPNKFGEGYTNPYVKGAAGRSEWNDRYMNMAKAIRNWQIAFLSVVIIAILLTLIVAKIATQSKIQPYIVETNGGAPYVVKKLTSLTAKDQLLINYIINQFIVNAKTILSDTEAEKKLLDKVYAYSAENTLNFLQEFYAKNNPFHLATNHTLNINIINAMPLSQNTWQVIWDETKRNLNNGAVLEVTRWMANITYKLGEVNPKFINENPFGIYITNVTWSQSRG
jgi:type IV secretion system protein TrbF